MTTSGHGLNSHNIQYKSQGDTIHYIRKPNQGRQIVTIPNICHEVVVTISDIYCITNVPSYLVATDDELHRMAQKEEDHDKDQSERGPRISLFTDTKSLPKKRENL